MLGGAGGGLFADSQPLPFVSSPALNAHLVTNFTPLSETLAFLHLIAFLYALSVMLGQWAGPPAPAQTAERKQMPRDAAGGSASGVEVQPYSAWVALRDKCSGRNRGKRLEIG